MRHSIVILFLLASSMSSAQFNGFVFQSVNGNQVQLTKGKTANVYVMISPECPLCQSYSRTLIQLYQSYSKRGITFYGIVPGKNYTAQAIKEFIATYSIPFEIVFDTDKKFTQYLNANITPEVFLINRQDEIVYSGRIDNWAYQLGKKRKLITQHDLRDAMESVINNQPVKIVKTKAIGCFIED